MGSLVRTLESYNVEVKVVYKLQIRTLKTDGVFPFFRKQLPLIGVLEIRRLSKNSNAVEDFECFLWMILKLGFLQSGC